MSAFIFLLGMICGITALLSSTLLIADHEFPNKEQLQFVTMVPVTSPIKQPNSLSVNQDNKELLLKTLSQWDAQDRKPALYVTVLNKEYRLYDRVPPQWILHEYQTTHSNPPVVVYSDGYQPIHPNHCGALRSILKTDVVPGILVSVGYPCDVWYNYRQFNYCQEQDVKTLRLTIEEVLSESSIDTKLVIAGGSKGALTSLHFLASLQEEHPKSRPTQHLLTCIQSAMMFCPITDFITSTHGLGRTGAWLRFWCPRLMPNYKTKPKALTDIRAFPNIPLFVSMLRRDTFVHMNDVLRCTDHFTTVGPLDEKHLQTFISDEPLFHGKIGLDPKHEQAVKMFLERFKRKQ